MLPTPNSDEAYYLGNIFYETCRSEGFNPQIVCRSGQWDFLSGLVDAGLGMAPFPVGLIKRLDKSRFAFVELIPQIRYDMQMIWRSGGYPCFAAKVFIEQIRSVLLTGELR
jgi:DNA-binding transcriptional LysR family regulator